MKKEWIVDIIRQCKKQNVAVFFKQWGGIRPKSGGRKINNKTFDKYPSIEKRKNVLKNIDFDINSFKQQNKLGIKQKISK